MAHFFGVSAVVLFLLSFQFKTRKNIIITNLTSRVLYILQYICLGALDGAILDFMGFVMSFFARYKEKDFITSHFKFIIIIVNLLLLISGIFMYRNIFSLFAMFGIILEITALWLTKEKNIRILSLISAPGWLIYNIANQAYGSVVGNVLTIISILIAMYRLDLNNS